VLGVLLDDAATPPVFDRQISGMNARDARMRPLAVGQMRAEQTARAGKAAAEWRKWRESLRRNPDAPEPELPE
jgi:hypothetical protein